MVRVSKVLRSNVLAEAGVLQLLFLHVEMHLLRKEYF